MRTLTVAVAEHAHTNRRDIAVPEHDGTPAFVLTCNPGYRPVVHIVGLTGTHTVDGYPITPTGYSAVADFAHNILRDRFSVEPLYTYDPYTVRETLSMTL